MSASHNANERRPGPVRDCEQTVDHAIQRAIEAEDLARNVYVQLSQMFAHVPDVSGFWQDLAYDEAKHVHALKKTQDSLSTEQLSAPADRRLLRGAVNVISLLSTFSAEAVKTLDNAYEFAHEIEFSELNYVFKCVASDFITRAEGRRIMFSEIEEHQKKLVDFTENFGDRTWRRQIPARSVAVV